MAISLPETLVARPARSWDDPPYAEKLVARPIVPMFASPNPLSEQVSQALLGMRVLETGGRGDWRLIQTPDGYQGWLATVGLADIPDRWHGPYVEVTDLWANLRGKADSKLTPVTQATIGARLPLVSRDEQWVEVLLPDSRHVWTEAIRVAEIGERALHSRSPRAICSTARRFLGTPYLWGGNSPLGIDCSGFVQIVMRLHGIELLRDANQQAAQGTPSLDPGAADLVFFGPVEQQHRITHVGMMLDGSRFIHAAGSRYVRIDRLSDEPYIHQFRFARRYL